jgi:hypothetical protein
VYLAIIISLVWAVCGEGALCTIAWLDVGMHNIKPKKWSLFNDRLTNEVRLDVDRCYVL